MIKTTLFILIALTFSACVNQHGISAKYYSDCEEYYDLQGFYHKECGKNDIMNYEELGEKSSAAAHSVYNTAEDAVGAVYDAGEQVVDSIIGVE